MKQGWPPGHPMLGIVDVGWEAPPRSSLTHWAAWEVGRGSRGSWACFLPRTAEPVPAGAQPACASVCICEGGVGQAAPVSAVR